ncbi:MAG TPA: hypothetical protein VFC06_01875, partial [Demequina sp.]|nr:hypothetical protein [Demequina sp.]
VISKWHTVGPDFSGELNAVLSEMGSTPVEDRIPVLAFGSNACPAQLRHKAEQSGFRLDIPLLEVVVAGVTVGHSATLSSRGYFPMTGVPRSSSIARGHLMLLDEHQLMAMDRSEPGFQRVLLSSRDGYALECGGVRLATTYMYVAREGHLIDKDNGSTLYDMDHEALLSRLVSSPGDLRALLGDDPEEIVARARRSTSGWLHTVVDTLHAAGWVERRDPANLLECHKDRRPMYFGAQESPTRVLWHTESDMADREQNSVSVSPILLW